MLMATWVHKAYPQSQTILLLLLAGQLIGTPMKVVTSVLFGMGDVRRPSMIYVVEAIANFAFSLSLIYSMGLVGVALGTMIPLYFIELGILLPYATKKLGFEPRRLLIDMVGPQLAPLVALLGYSYVVWSRVPLTPGWSRIVTIAAGGAVVLGATWLAQQKVWRWWSDSKGKTGRWSDVFRRHPACQGGSRALQLPTFQRKSD